LLIDAVSTLVACVEVSLVVVFALVAAAELPDLCLPPLGLSWSGWAGVWETCRGLAGACLLVDGVVLVDVDPEGVLRGVPPTSAGDDWTEGEILAEGVVTAELASTPMWGDSRIDFEADC
jgi:hypothetical protein